MSPASSAPRAIVFGKTPAHGDFIQRGLDPAAHEAWDRWASDLIVQAQARLGPEFAAVHGAAPPWRFVAGPGLLGQGWRAGALTASIDSAGRRFLLVLAIDAMTWSQAAAQGAEIARRMEGQLFEGLARGSDADALIEAAQAALDPEPATAEAFAAFTPQPPGPGLWWTLGGGRHQAGAVVAAMAPGDLLIRGLRAEDHARLA